MKPGDTKMIHQVIPLPVRMSFTAGDIASSLDGVEAQLRHAMTKMPRAYGQLIVKALEDLEAARKRLVVLASVGASVKVGYEGYERSKADAREQD